MNDDHHDDDLAELVSLFDATNMNDDADDDDDVPELEPLHMTFNQLG